MKNDVVVRRCVAVGDIRHRSATVIHRVAERRVGFRARTLTKTIIFESAAASDHRIRGKASRYYFPRARRKARDRAASSTIRSKRSSRGERIYFAGPSRRYFIGGPLPQEIEQSVPRASLHLFRRSSPRPFSIALLLSAGRATVHRETRVLHALLHPFFELCSLSRVDFSSTRNVSRRNVARP